MNLIGISINHRTSPIELREAVHLSKEEQQEFIAVLKSDLLKEGFILSTCNRTEIFGIPKNNHTNDNTLRKELIKFKKVDGLEHEHVESFDSTNSLQQFVSLHCRFQTICPVLRPWKTNW